jgi:SAM-dependent methyltransferase
MNTWETRWRIVLVRPPGYIHTDGLREVAESLHYAFRRLAIRSGIAENEYAPGERHIVLGAHLLQEDEYATLPPTSILYNLEQIDAEALLRMPEYAKLLSLFHVWDYSERNAERLRSLVPNVQVSVLPMGFVPELARIEPAVSEDIDVLFYGSINERRRKIIEELVAAGLNVQVVFGAYGKKRDALIARSKVILNVHFYDSKIFESVRVSYLLTNRRAVVSECGDDTEIEADFREALACVEYARLVDACVALVRDDDRRHQQESAGFDAMSRRSLPRMLSTVIGVPVNVEAESLPVLPLRLNLGSGKNFRVDCINLDISSLWRPDIMADAGKLRLPAEFDTDRFGRITVFAGMFDEIVANDVLEHIPNLVEVMTTCLALLKPGGEFHIKVPYDLSFGAWQDPTHVRAFNERSWLYYTEWFWYLGWKESRFDQANLTCMLSELGVRVQQQGISLEEILRTPRAVDDLVVVLQKRLLTDEERLLAKEYQAQ